MINAIEYTVERKGVSYALHADKNTAQKNAWHLKTIDGNGMPPTSAIGGASYGIAGRSYGGLSVDAREIELEMYADGFSPAGCQQMLNDASRVITPDNEALGVLRLTNALGETYRIPAKAVDFAVNTIKRRSALVSAVFHCPYAYFESDVLNSVPFFAYEGGKEYPIGVGLERPYTFGDIPTANDMTRTITAYNAGDVAAPIVLRLFGSGFTRVEVVNETTGASILLSNLAFANVGGSAPSGVEISTDESNLYARDTNGGDVSAYVSLFSRLSDFKLEPGANVITVRMEAYGVTVAGTRIEWRGRYSTCL